MLTKFGSLIVTAERYTAVLAGLIVTEVLVQRPAGPPLQEAPPRELSVCDHATSDARIVERVYTALRIGHRLKF